MQHESLCNQNPTRPSRRCSQDWQRSACARPTEIRDRDQPDANGAGRDEDSDARVTGSRQPRREPATVRDGRLKFYNTHRFVQEQKQIRTKLEGKGKKSGAECSQAAKLGKRKSDELFSNTGGDDWGEESRADSPVRFEEVRATQVVSESVSEHEEPKQALRSTRLRKREHLAKTKKKCGRIRRSLKSKILRKRKTMKSLKSKNRKFLWEMTRRLSSKLSRLRGESNERAKQSIERNWRRTLSWELEKNGQLLVTDLGFVGNFSDKIVNEQFLIRRDSLRRVLKSAIAQFQQTERELTKLSLKREMRGLPSSADSEDELREDVDAASDSDSSWCSDAGLDARNERDSLIECLLDVCRQLGFEGEALVTGIVFVDHYLARSASRRIGGLNRRKLLLTCLYLAMTILSCDSWENQNRIIEESQTSHTQSQNQQGNALSGTNAYRVGLEPEKNAFVVKKIIVETCGLGNQIIAKSRSRQAETLDEFPKSIYSKWRDQQNWQRILIESCASGKQESDSRSDLPELQTDLLSHSNAPNPFSCFKDSTQNWSLHGRAFKSDLDALRSPRRCPAELPETAKSEAKSLFQLFQDRLDQLTTSNEQGSRSVFVRNYIEKLFESSSQNGDESAPKLKLTTEQLLEFGRRKLAPSELEKFILDLVESVGFQGRPNRSGGRQPGQLLRSLFSVFPHRPPFPAVERLFAEDLCAQPEPVPRQALHRGIAGLSAAAFCSQQASLLQANLLALRIGRKQAPAQLRDSASRSDPLFRNVLGQLPHQLFRLFLGRPLQETALGLLRSRRAAAGPLGRAEPLQRPVQEHQKQEAGHGRRPTEPLLRGE